MGLKQLIKKPQILAKIAVAFLVVLCCAIMPADVKAFNLADGLASVSSFWRGVTCFFGINCPTNTNEVPSANSQIPNNNQSSSHQYPNGNDNAADTSGANADAVGQGRTSAGVEDRPWDTNTNSNSNPTIVQNINPTKEIQTKEIQTIHTNTVTERTNTVVIDEETKNKVNILLRQLDSDRPNYSVGQTYALPANLLGTTLNIGAGSFTIGANGDANAQNFTTEHDLTVRGNFTVSGSQTNTGAASFTTASTGSVLSVANTGSGAALQVDNITVKANTLNTAMGNLILNSYTGLIEIAGSAIKLTSAVPMDTAMSLYNDSGTLKWNGAALAMGSSVSGTTGYLSKFTASNALGNSVLYESGGNVGIGTTAPFEKIEVNIGNIKAFGGYFVSQRSMGNEWFIGKEVNGANRFRIKQDVNSPYPVLMQTSADGTNWNNGLSMNLSNGNVGIGTTVPGAPLTVVNTTLGQSIAQFTNAIGTYSFIDYNLNTPNSFIIQPSGNGYLKLASGPNTHANSSVQIYTRNLERMRIDNAGNVGIGTTAPAYKLDIAGDLRATATSTFAGKVGIGTTAPTWELDVVGSIKSTGTVYAGGVSMGSTGLVKNAAAYGMYTFGAVTPSGANPLTLYSGSATYNDGYINFSTAGSERMRIDSAGNVGIGTTIPGAKLHVSVGSSGGSSFAGSTLVVESGGNNYIQMLSGTTAGAGMLFGTSVSNVKGSIEYLHTDDALRFFTNSSERVRINSSGNVGVGTTAPGYPLDVNGVIRTNSTVFAAAMSPAAIFLNGGNYQITNKAGSSWINFATRNVSGSEAVYDLSNIGTLTTSGNVGIGTTAPGAKLDVAGLLRVADSNGHYFQFNKIAGGEGTFVTDENGFNFQPANGLAYVFKPAVNGMFRVYGSSGVNNYIQIAHDNTNGTLSTAVGNIVLSPASGNVGIGTIVPEAKLHVSGGNIEFDEQYGIRVRRDGTDTPIMQYLNSDELRIGVPHNLDTNILTLYTDDAERMRITSTGNVGIGTTAPAATLEVKNTSATGDIFKITNSSGNSSFTIDNDTLKAKFWAGNGVNSAVIGFAGTTGLGYGVGSNLSLITSSTSRVLIDSTGNVGIGTTSIGAKLYVAGGGYGTAQLAGSGANQGAYAVGAQSFASDSTIYAYGNICTGNSAGNCGGSGGVVFGTSNTNATVNITATTSFLNGGNVGIGTTAPSQKLDVNGKIKVGDLSTAGGADDVYSVGGVLTTVVSSQRFKENIRGYENVMPRIGQLQPVHFKWKGDTATPGREDFGFIAEDAAVLFPELATYEEDGTTIRGFKYDKLPILLTKAIQEQQEEIDGLKLTLGPTGALGDASLTSALALGGSESNWVANTLKSLGLALQDGVASLKEITLDKLNSREANIKKIQTEEICVDDVCVTKDQFKQMLQNAGGTTIPAPSAPASVPQAPVLPADSSGAATIPPVPTSQVTQETAGQIVEPAVAETLPVVEEFPVLESATELPPAPTEAVSAE